MAIKKSELYSSLWKSCDELRGGMDASQYKDYVLVMLFIKYISDKYAGEAFSPITVPKGSSFKDMVALKGKTSIGDDINKKILAPLGEANKISDFPDFNDVNKLGSGKEMVQRLTNLIAIFENPSLDFSGNKAEGDDILGDAYEYLMRHFATESGKSKGQFYTPAEVSRIMAKIIHVSSADKSSKTAYDPTCGSGSLLLKVSAEAGKITLYGQEMDVATSSLARMNMILHDNPTAEIKQGNTLANPLYLTDKGDLKQFDFFVANPPFSFKAWSNGIDPINDRYGRFQDFGIPPQKNGDFAFLLHAVRSLKSNGKGAIILPHGVLFRGNAEAEIRKKLIQKGYIEGIIGLPANLFYGTGIPACIIVINKEEAETRKELFIVDASKGFEKDGNKNRLREQDIHKIVDVFTNKIQIPKYSRKVTFKEIEEKEFNLNIPRYIDSSEPEDIQNIEAHLHGGIPELDVDALSPFWEVYQGLKETLFTTNKRKGFYDLKCSKEEIKTTIYSHPEFVKFGKQIENTFAKWKESGLDACKSIGSKTKPKVFIHNFSESLLTAFSKTPLVDAYDIYQHLMTYWLEVMQDDVYLVVDEGWKVGKEIEPIGKSKEFEGRLIPKALLIQAYFAKEKESIETLESERDSLDLKLEEMVEEQGGDEGLLSDAKTDKDTITPKSVQARLKQIQSDKDAKEEINFLQEYLNVAYQVTDLNSKIKQAQTDLQTKVSERYKTLKEEEIKTLVVESKWFAKLSEDVQSELNRISQTLTKRIKELAERYESPLETLEKETEALDKKVKGHLAKMGFEV
ncbi:type I restriction-modification system subunit M [Leptospira bouyouniensis]|uniref:site-specific DNA-methyltransferase (adenine-specific) n=1 Tax=Leptospira bouyouniensis TaxID=2484911 RepID=A0A7I0HQ69_9LEPT|nr:type I restriction-modification system subunit M [Leptospira bouyouniensis]TGL04061.1 type I restriction-modification system subunit M [Leptospira bouyouniensis]